MGLPNLRCVLRLFSENEINVDDQHFNFGESKQGSSSPIRTSDAAASKNMK
jgi:hypothetical protein